MMPHVNQLLSTPGQEKQGTIVSGHFRATPLTSWREIATYLGKGVRTVQRWERELGLPVARFSGSSRVIAHCDEIDEWLRTRMRVRPAVQNRPDLSPVEAHNERLQRLHELLNQSAERALAVNRNSAECLARARELCQRARS